MTNVTGPRRSAILVLGCHRSGTSLLTRGMLATGADLADHLIEPGPDNPRGFWEDAEVVRLNREMLEQAGSTWDSAFPGPARQLKNRARWTARAAELLKANYADTSLFAIKDPTMCLLVPVWVDALKSLDIETRAAVILRSPLAVADSLRKRNGFSLEKSLLLWLSYNWSLVAETALDALPISICDYDQLMAAPVEVLDGLLTTLGIESDRSGLDEFARDFVDSSLRHSVHSLSDLSNSPTAKLTRSLAEALFPLCEPGAADHVHERLDALRKSDLGDKINHRLDAFIPRDRSSMLSGLRDELDDTRESLRQAMGWKTAAERLEAEIDEKAAAFQAELDRVNAHLAEKETGYQSAVADLRSEMEQVHEGYRREIARKEEELFDAGETLSQAREELATIAEELEDSARQREEIVAGYERQVASMHGELEAKDRGYQAAIDTISRERDALVQSYSYRLGRAMTFPARKVWAVAVRPVVRNQELRRLAKQARRNPASALKLFSPRRLRNLFRIIYQQPELSAQVFRHYGEQLKTDSGRLEVQVIEHVDAEGLAFEPQERPRVSVIIPVYNQLDYTLGCLRSIQNNLPSVPMEVIVADDCSSDDTEAVLRAVPGLRYIRNDANLRFLLSVNNAARQARGDYLFLLNNDTQVQPGWLDSLVSTFDSFPDAGVVGSRLLYPDGRLQEAGGIVWRDASAWNFGRLDDPEKPEYNYLKDADYISGAALMVRRDLFEKLGGFDERFVPAYYEDTDLCFEARRLGYRTLLQPRSNVVHFEGISHGTDTSTGIKQHQVDNQARFLDKWRDELESRHFPNGESVFLARDRGQTRRTVLVVDHYVPHFDRDAGSRSTYQYLKLFLAEGFNVKFLGDNFFKHEPYTSRLEELGIEVLYGNEYAQNWQDWLLQNAAMIDVIYFHRPHITEKYLDTVARMEQAPRIIYFGHDLHFLRMERQAELEDSDPLKLEAEEWKARELKIFDAVDLVYYPSQVEIDHIRELRPGIDARAIPLYVFDGQGGSPYDPAERRDVMFIGGFNHPPNADAILWFASVFSEVQGRIGDIKLHIVGSNMPDRVTELASEHIIVHGFLEDEDVDALYTRVRLSVVPLRFGAGIKGKVLESMHKGVPVLTTTIGAEGILDAEQCLSIADNGDFGDQLAQLYPDMERLQALSDAGREAISTHYSVEAARAVVIGDFS